MVSEFLFERSIRVQTYDIFWHFIPEAWRFNKKRAFDVICVNQVCTLFFACLEFRMKHSGVKTEQGMMDFPLMILRQREMR